VTVQYLINNQSPQSAFEKLLECVEHVTKCKKDCIIAGDFNVNWKGVGTKRAALENWCESFGLNQQVETHTRRREILLSDGTKRLQQSLLDLVFTREPKKLKIYPSISSDHDLICVYFPDTKATHVQSKKSITVDWRRYSAAEANLRLNKLPIRLNNPRTILDSLTSNLIQILNELAPKRVIKLRGEKEFINSEINALKKKETGVGKSLRGQTLKFTFRRQTGLLSV